MFTGIIEKTGTIENLSKKKDTYRLSVCAGKIPDSVKKGDSISVNGTCLTVVAMDGNSFHFDVTEATYRNTSFSRIKIKSTVNIEYALRSDSRLNGHFVLGHVDSVQKITAIEKGTNSHVDIAIHSADNIYVVKKGSIAIDGISLTIGEVYKNSIRIYVIPHTFDNTNLKYKTIGDLVNIEFDILGKYVKNMAFCKDDNPSVLTESFLKSNGFI